MCRRSTNQSTTAGWIEEKCEKWYCLGNIKYRGDLKSDPPKSGANPIKLFTPLDKFTVLSCALLLVFSGLKWHIWVTQVSEIWMPGRSVIKDTFTAHSLLLPTLSRFQMVGLSDFIWNLEHLFNNLFSTIWNQTRSDFRSTLYLKRKLQLNVYIEFILML